LPAQHPLGHVLALHTHWPFTHFCPAEHAGFAPHVQLPPLQPSASATLHDPHEPPPLPQALIEFGVHALLLQQPFGQLAALHWHWPFTHCWPAAHGAFVPHLHAPVALQVSAAIGSHATHAAPPTPHAPIVGDVH
jgi:hypothetical protein